MAHLSDAEAGTRGYLTGELSYIERQAANFTGCNSALDQLTALIREDPIQEKRAVLLRQKFADKIAFLKQATDLRQSGSEESARVLFETGRGRQIMEEAREIAERIERTERELSNAEELKR